MSRLTKLTEALDDVLDFTLLTETGFGKGNQSRDESDLGVHVDDNGEISTTNKNTKVKGTGRAVRE